MGISYIHFTTKEREKLLQLKAQGLKQGEGPESGGGEDMWTPANRIIVDVYNKIAGSSTVPAGLMSTTAVAGAKVSNNQYKTDQSRDRLKRIWIAWTVINGMGAFLSYVRPLFQGLAAIS